VQGRFTLDGTTYISAIVILWIIQILCPHQSQVQQFFLTPWIRQLSYSLLRFLRPFLLQLPPRSLVLHGQFQLPRLQFHQLLQRHLPSMQSLLQLQHHPKSLLQLQHQALLSSSKPLQPQLSSIRPRSPPLQLVQSRSPPPQ
jgi:hypothetical protein